MLGENKDKTTHDNPISLTQSYHYIVLSDIFYIDYFIQKYLHTAGNQ